MKTIDLSIVIPTFNERKRLPKTYGSIVSYLKAKKVNGEIIISDDGSTDGTLDFANSLKGIPGQVETRVVSDPKRQGKGAGVKRGILASRGEWVLFMDADNSTHLLEIEKFSPYKKDFDVIIGSRYAEVEQEIKQNIIRQAISRLGAFMVRSFTGLNYKDTQCGFKMFTKKSARDIFSTLEGTGWGFDVEVLFLAKKFGYRVKEVGVIWRDSEGSHLRPGFDSIKTFFEIWAISRRVKLSFHGLQSKNK